MLTHSSLLIRSSGSYRASPPNNAPWPGHRSHLFKVPGQATVAGEGTVALTSIMEPRVPDGPRPAIASFANKRSANTKGLESLMRLENRMVSPGGSPVCRCSMCASRRATQLTQALESKFGSKTPTQRIQ
jgi:hypothetical protein